MSNYTIAVAWNGKDALADTDASKVISGDDFDAEFTAVQVAVNSKANLNGTVSESFSADNTTVGGTLAVTGATTLTGATTATSLTASGAVTFNGTVSGTNVKDEDNMVSNSATSLATQQSIKAYIDAQIAALVFFDWTVSEVNTSFTAGSYVYTLPSNAIAVVVSIDSVGSGNLGGRMDAQVKNSAGTILHTVRLGGFNINNGSDGGSGMTAAMSIFLPVPSSATTITFIRGSGSRSPTGIIETCIKRV
jgi:hypothetical protein